MAIPPELGNLTALASLDLSGNGLAAIPPELGDLTALVTLDLAGNGLAAIPPELGELAALTSLDLSGNRLAAIPPELGELAALTSLNLSSNRLVVTPAELGELSALAVLDLSGNRLVVVLPELGELAALTALDLSGNELIAIPRELGALSTLTTLDLSGNRLTAIQPQLGELAALTTLDLSGNGLTGAVPPELGRLTRLRTLDLSGNRLGGAIPPELGMLSGLALDLSGTQLYFAPPALALVPAFPGLPRLKEPVGLVEVPEHDLFLIVLREGRVLAVPRGGPWSAPRTVHDQRGRTSTTAYEEGLLAVALDPEFARNGYVYAYYSANPRSYDHTSRLVRFATTGAGASFVFDAASELLILEIEQVDGYHNGGALLFGPDGMLYLGLGDGAGGDIGDPHGHGQNPGTLPGTIVRIDVRGATADTRYATPPDNPIRDREDARPEVWAHGLRNPWRMSFDRETGILWASDVGHDQREEINIVRAGANYGWNVTEGTLCFSPEEGCDRSGITPPLLELDRSYGCAIVGGFVYRGEAIPALRGWYLFTDYCNSRIRAIPAEGFAEAADPVTLQEGGPDFVVSFAEDAAGELYIVSHEGARIYRVIAAPATSRATGSPP